MREERLSAQKCLQVCEQLSQHIAQMQLRVNSTDHPDPQAVTTYEELGNKGLEECKAGLARTIADLERNVKDLTDGLIVKSRAAMVSTTR